jgi:hypothetical protein
VPSFSVSVIAAWSIALIVPCVADGAAMASPVKPKLTARTAGSRMRFMFVVPSICPDGCGRTALTAMGHCLEAIPICRVGGSSCRPVRQVSASMRLRVTICARRDSPPHALLIDRDCR